MHFSKKYMGIIFLFVVVFTPAVLWWQVQTINIQKITSFISGIGELSGIIGTVLFSLALILSARPIFLDKFFGGLNKLYDYHSKIGQVAFILLLAHPVLLLTRYAAHLNDAVAFFSLSHNWQQNFGIISLYISIIVIILTLYLRPKYHIWKYVHKLLGLALFIGALHVYLSPSYVLHSSAVLNVYVLGWAIVGIAVWLYKSVFGKEFAKIYEYTTHNVIALNDDIVEIDLIPNNEKMDFTPGQFVFVSFQDTNLPKEKHPFSIVSLPSNKMLRIAVKSLGDFTNKLNSLKLGSRARVEGPFGNFSYKNHKYEKQVWVAGGIGVTPFISMANDLRNNKYFDVKMYYAVRNSSEAVYLNLLKEVENDVENFTITAFYSDENGFITSEYVASNVQDIFKRDILICAPPAMIHALKSGFKNYGISNSHLYSEEFNF